jgi:mitochondrial distribution and morphology protein 10
VSTGIRFTTLPDATPPSLQVPAPASASHKPLPPQPPITVTALFNPMLGYISGAYTAQVSRDLSLSSRFEFNVYSFESDWTMGTEWWLRSPPEGDDVHSSSPVMQDVHGVLKARASTSNVCHAYSAYFLILTSAQNISLLWEGRLKSMLIGLGVVADLSHRSRPIRGVGLELSYFSSD